VQEVIRDLKSGAEAKSVDTTPTIEFDFKAKFAETKAAAKVFCVLTGTFSVVAQIRLISRMPCLSPRQQC